MPTETQHRSGSAVVPLLPGFEEIEAVTVIDVLRRAEVPVIVASERPGPVRGSHDIEVVADSGFADIDPGEVALVALPGGMPGAERLRDHPAVQSLVKQVAERGALTAAICAGPIALSAAGLLRGKRATCFPGFERQLDGAEHGGGRVIRDGEVVTSQGPGTALEFALELVAALRGREVADELEARMLVSRPRVS